MSVRRLRTLLVVCSILTAAVLLHAQAPGPATSAQQPVPPAGDNTPVFRSSINAIQVDVVATDRDGRPVNDLKIGDFEVLEDGRPQELTTFARIQMPSERTAETFQNVEADVRSNVDPEGRVYVFALDEIPADAALRTRLLLRQFIETYFGPHDVGAVVHIGRALRSSGQDLTRSKQRLLAAVDKYSGGAPDVQANDEATAASWESDKRINQLESLAELVEFMLKLPAGRKAMLLVSLDLSSDGALAQVDVNQVLTTPSRARTLNAFCVQPDVNRAMSCRPSQAVHRALAAAAHSNLVIYPINPLGVTGNGRDWDLRELAEATGGFAVANTNDYAASFARIVQGHGNYYLLGFNSSYTGREGRNVPLEVLVKRPDITVDARTGYISPFREERRLFDPRGASQLARALASPVASRGLPMQVTAAPFKGTGDKSSTTLIVQMDASKVRFTESRGTQSGRIDLWSTATDGNGKIIPGRKFTVRFALQPATRTKLAASGLRLLAPVSLAAGRYQLRVAAGNDDVTGSVVYDLDVPDFTSAFSMSGVLIASARSADILTFSPSGTPPLPGAEWGTPTTVREFTRGETIRVYAELYERQAASPHPLTVEATLRNAGGRLMVTRLHRRSTNEPREQTGGHGFSIDLPLANVPAGTYALQVQGSSAVDRSRSITRSLLIQVK